MMTAVADDLARVREAFAAWRATHGRGRLPESLWGRALALLDRYSVAEIARELRLNQGRIRAKRSEGKRLGAVSPNAEPPAFVQVPPALLALPAVEPEPIRVEIVRPDGVCLRVTIGPSHSDALAAVCSVFLRGAA
jgi:hypothetical protein